MTKDLEAGHDAEGTRRLYETPESFDEAYLAQIFRKAYEDAEKGFFQLKKTTQERNKRSTVYLSESQYKSLFKSLIEAGKKPK